MRSRRSSSGRPLGDTKESDRRVTCKAPLAHVEGGSGQSEAPPTAILQDTHSVEGVFCEVRMCGVPRTPYAGCWIAPVLCRKARECPGLCTQWGTPPEGPPFPSILVSKHMPSAKKTPICGICKG